MNSDPYTLHTKDQIKMGAEPNARGRTIKPLQENLCELGWGSEFLNTMNMTHQRKKWTDCIL